MTAPSPKRRPTPPEFALPLSPCNAAVRRCPVPRAQASRRILIMRLGAHGDILMGTPLLTALRAAWPDAHITWMVERKERQAVDAHPLVDEVLLWDGSYWKRMLRLGLFPVWLVRAWQMRRVLRRCRYDIFISFQPEEWPLFTQAVQAPVRIGVFDTFYQTKPGRAPSPHTGLYTTAYTHAHLPPHRTDQYLLPLKTLGLPPPVSPAMSIGYTCEDAACVDTFLAAQTAALPPHAHGPLVVLAPLTTWPSRCWPAARYAALGDALAAQGCRVALIGSAKEQPAVAALAAQMQHPPILAAGVFSFRQMASLIASAALLVSGDTGPMHVAAAVGTRFVALFGPTPVRGRLPLAGAGTALSHAVPCGPCDQKFCPNTGDNYLLCQNLISVDEVRQAAERLLNTSPAAAAT